MIFKPFGENFTQDGNVITIQKSDLGLGVNPSAQQIFAAIIENSRKYFQGIITANGIPILVAGNDPLEYDNSRGKSIGIYYTRNDVIDAYQVAILKIIFRIPGDELTPLDINDL